AAAGAVEDEVAPPGLVGRDVAAGVVLVAGEARDQHADPGEAVPHQARAVEAVDVGAVADALARAVERATTPRVRHAHLRAHPLDHVLDRLAAVQPWNLATGIRGGPRGGSGLPHAVVTSVTAALANP